MEELCTVQTSAGVFAYRLRQSARARHLAIVVHPGGAIAVTAPARVSERAIAAFFEERALRIARAVARLARATTPISLPPATARERAALVVRLTPVVARAARALGIAAPPFTVRTMRSRCGSCSARRARSFSDTLRALPEELFGYIVAHEVAHCVEHNHSPAFWALVARVIPDWKSCRRALKRYCFVINNRQ